MYVSNATLRSKEDVVKVIAEQKARKALYEMIYSILEKYDGKVLNARITSFVKSESADALSASIEKPKFSSTGYINIYSKELNSVTRHMFNLDFSTDKFSYARFIELNPMPDFQKWIDDYEALLLNYDAIVSEFRSAEAAYMAASAKLSIISG